MTFGWTVGTRLYTWLHGELVGKDQFGNRYYIEKRARPGARRKRWVIYAGEIEASKVPAEWHAWLHYMTDQPIAGEAVENPAWRKEHLPNLTGTEDAYLPPGHDRKGGRRERSTADYQPWRP